LENRLSKIIQRLYEVFCFVCLIGLLPFIGDKVKLGLPFLLVPFILISFTNHDLTKKISFGLFFTLLSYSAWTFVITIWATNFVLPYLQFGDFGGWDLVAFLLPAIFAIATLTWALRKRTPTNQFDRWYMVTIMVTMLIIINCC
jgi:hypothetical protein